MRLRAFLTSCIVVIGFAGSVAAQRPATGLQDLVGIRASSGEVEMERRGYRFIRTEKSGGDAYSYWQETENGQCVTIRTSDGRYRSIVYAPAVDCRGGGGSDEGNASEGAVRGLQDLIGVRASSAADEMVRRGYTQVGSQTDMDSVYSFWRENRTRRCVAARTSNGRFQDIYYTSASDCSGSQGSGAGNSRGGVTLYRDINYRGGSETFSGDVPDLRRSSIGNDQASSVRVDRGCRVEMFKDINYRGSSETFTGDAPDLRRSAIGNDTVSSMRVRCGGGYGDDEWGDVPFGATLYRDIDFAGTKETFTGDVPDMRRSTIGNDTVTSVRVSPGCRVRLYKDINYGGAYTELDSDESDLRRTTVGNDAVSSIRVRCGR